MHASVVIFTDFSVGASLPALTELQRKSKEISFHFFSFFFLSWIFCLPTRPDVEFVDLFNSRLAHGYLLKILDFSPLFGGGRDERIVCVACVALYVAFLRNSAQNAYIAWQLKNPAFFLIAFLFFKEKNLFFFCQDKPNVPEGKIMVKNNLVALL